MSARALGWTSATAVTDALIVLAGGALQAVAEAAGLIDQIAARIEDAIGLRDNVPHAPREGATSA